ncbi:hypothetical protein ACQP3D_26960, partial [Escherichia coli]
STDLSHVESIEQIFKYSFEAKSVIHRINFNCINELSENFLTFPQKLSCLLRGIRQLREKANSLGFMLTVEDKILQLPAPADIPATCRHATILDGLL